MAAGRDVADVTNQEATIDPGVAVLTATQQKDNQALRRMLFGRPSERSKFVLGPGMLPFPEFEGMKKELEQATSAARRVEIVLSEVLNALSPNDLRHCASPIRSRSRGAPSAHPTPPDRHRRLGHREQAAIIDYLLDEHRVLREQPGKRRLRLTDDQRQRLAAKGVALGRRLLDQIATNITPDTILRWHSRLIAARWTCPTERRVGRPGA